MWHSCGHRVAGGGRGFICECQPTSALPPSPGERSCGHPESPCRLQVGWWGRHPGPALRVPSALPSLAVHSSVVLFALETSASFQLNPVGVPGCSPLTVQFSRSVMSDSLRPHGLQHARFPCPSPTPEACSNSSTKSAMPSNHLILCRPLLLLPSIFPSIRVFSSKSVLHIR